jgi:glyoxylate/hydroxypyruvate reductase
VAQPHGVTVLIGSYLEPEHAQRIARVHGARVVYEPDLLPPPRYKADHHGAPLQRSDREEQHWRDLLAQADVMFDFDYTNLDRMVELAPRLRWVQATSAVIGPLLVRSGLIHSPITFTTASGIHAIPLAEFVLMAMLWFAKGGRRMIQDQAAHHWERTCARELRGATAGLIGLGGVGTEVARVCRAVGLRVVATKRTPGGRDADDVVDMLVPISQLSALLRLADVLVLAVPQTPETAGLIGRAELELLPPGAILINIARGAVVDEGAMIDALRGGRLAGAALDVFAQEPLPESSPLWDMPNVLISPHSASTVESENAKLTDLFCDNLDRYLRGAPLRNVFDRARLY